MLSQISRLFNLYCDYHYSVPAPGFAVVGVDGENWGHVDRVHFGHGSVRVEGWSTVDKVALGSRSNLIWQRPNLPRQDVAVAQDLPFDRCTGFNLSSSESPEEVVLSLQNGSSSLQITLPRVKSWEFHKARLSIRASFFQRALRNLPTLAKAYFNPTDANKTQAKRALRLVSNQSVNTLDKKFFEHSRPSLSPECVTIIMPVYNAFDLACTALERIEKNTDLPWRIVLIEDCSSDQRVRPMLRTWCDRNNAIRQNAILLENDENLGFVGSVNRGFEEALRFKNHVVLLNSDAFVPKDWASRLIQPILRNSNIASVTPLSNDAEIFNVPFAGRRTTMPPGMADSIDASLRKYASDDTYQSAPTGVGFCMAINQKYLAKFPKFDALFGKGYGEEVDWCCRISELGGCHVVQPSLFVEHRGAASFGSNEKQAAIARNNQIISKRYPQYDLSVQQFIAEDPIRTARIFSALTLLSAQQDQVDIYIAHSLGGGAEQYLEERIKAAHFDGNGIVVLRVGGRSRWRLEVHFQNGTLNGESDAIELINQTLKAISNAHIIYSCAVGDRDPANLPTLLASMVKEAGAKFTFLVHDYFAISPSYCLLDSDDQFRQDKIAVNLDSAHSTMDKYGRTFSASQWRAQWLVVMQMAETIKCFSASSVETIRTAFPTLKTQINLEPHSIPKLSAVHRLSKLENPKLGVLGDIGVQKGAKCISRLSYLLPYDGLRGLCVIGRVDPRFSLGPEAFEIGKYNRMEISALAERNQIAAWLIPSIWPETFSYTIHEALATGLPVFCFDLGAQQEAALASKNGHVLPLEWAEKPDLILQHITKVLDDVSNGRRVHIKAKGARCRDITAQSKSAS